MQKLAWLVFMIGSFATGQTVTVTASHLQNASGQLISGYVYLQPTLTSGQPTWYRAPGGGTVSSAAVPVPVVNGVLSVTLPDTTLTYPANLCFTMTYPQGSLATGYNCLQPHTTAYNSSDWCQAGVCNLDNYLPGNQPLPTINAVSSINYTAGNLTFTGSGFSQSGNTFTFPAGAGLSLTTTGTSGASTLSGGILNVPQYQAALGYTPAHSGANSDITSLTGLTTPLSVLQGGTGQNSLVPTTPVTTTPSGSCAQGAPNQQDTVTGIQYSCQNVVSGVGTWGVVGGGVSGPSTSTAGDLPSFVDTTGKTLADSGVNWNGSTNTLAFPGAVNITAGGTSQDITLTPGAGGSVVTGTNTAPSALSVIGGTVPNELIFNVTNGIQNLISVSINPTLTNRGDIELSDFGQDVLEVGNTNIAIDIDNPSPVNIHTGAAKGQSGANLNIGSILTSFLAGTVSTHVNPVTCTGTCTINLTLGNIQEITLTGNVTSVVFTNSSSGNYQLIWLQGATPYTVGGLPANWYGMTAPASTATTYARQTCDFDGTNGYCGALTQNAD